MRITVVGLGKIGLPLAVQYAGKGHRVTGLDVDSRTVERVNAGEEPFPGEAELAERLADLVPAGVLRATTDYAEAVPDADVVVVVVPLVVDAESRPDFTIMDAATAELARHLTADTLVVYETTLPVGTTRGRWLPMIEAGSGLVGGRDFHVVFSPERVLTGRVFADLRRYPKLIGALDEAGAVAAREFYVQVLDFDERPDLPRPNGVWDLGSAEAAELAKLAETTYRDVNIGLANQFAVYAQAHGIDIGAVIEACNSQPYSHLHNPGISVGGHCIPVYPRLYLAGDPDASVVRAARAANAAMPAYAVSLLAAAHGSLEGARVVVLGAAYRGGVKETAFSGVFDLVRELSAHGAHPVVHDPMFTADELTALGLEPTDLPAGCDAAVLHTDHIDYAELGSDDLPGVRVLLDGRRMVDADRFPDAAVVTLGRPGAS